VDHLGDGAEVGGGLRQGVYGVAGGDVDGIGGDVVAARFERCGRRSHGVVAAVGQEDEVAGALPAGDGLADPPAPMTTMTFLLMVRSFADAGGRYVYLAALRAGRSAANMVAVSKRPARRQLSVPLWLVGLAVIVSFAVAVLEIAWEPPLPLAIAGPLFILVVAAVGAVSSALYVRAEKDYPWPRAALHGLGDGVRFLFDLF
jgi:hypothetical protein